MNPLLRFLAVLMVLAAIVLAGFAYMLSRQPVQSPKLAVPPVVQAEPARAETFPVGVASHDLKAGEVLSASALRTEQWPQVPAQAYPGDTALVDKVLRFDVREGQPLTSFLLARGLSNYLDEDQRALEIPVAPITDWRTIRPGDLVDIYFTLSQGAEVGSTQSRMVMARVRVLAYGGRTLDHPVLSGEADKNTKIPSHAVVAVHQAQVNLLLLLSSKGTLQFVLRSVQDTSEPDPALFPKRERVLEGRADLDTTDQLRLTEPANVAYAGESLGQVAATQPSRQTTASRGEGPADARSKTNRSIQIIRGHQTTQQSY
jgi:pilus assembly protein CpaB